LRLMINSNFVACCTGKSAVWRLSRSCPRKQPRADAIFQGFEIFFDFGSPASASP
jgi:hypothetical protein